MPLPITPIGLPAIVTTTVAPVVATTASAAATTTVSETVKCQLSLPMPNGITLYIDIAVERGAQPALLEEYYLPLVRELEQMAGAADIRCAPQDSMLAYRKWTGALAAAVRAQPPTPGTYLARSTNELAQVVIEALSPLCSLVIRGMR